ncbi:hypothetical protein CAP36_03190 [Chitinophagaceae bacterium IBVUCB2]|nr:hypothetical protein CAP36_03190 [Chitinophagaceae bacterium IBVUCB2]
MKFFFIVIPLFFICCKSDSTSSGCEKVRKGKFGFQGNIINRGYLIERNDSIQIETDEASGTILEFNINWTSPCEYVLTWRRFKEKGRDSTMYESAKTAVVRTVINKVTPDFYVFTSKVDGSSNELTDTMGISKSY